MTHASPDKVLFLAYTFPPVGGIGVQRSLGFVKYLSRFGWSPTVVTVKPISYYVYDPSLLDELPPEVRVERTGSLDPLRVSAIALRDARRQRGASPAPPPVAETAAAPRGAVRHPFYHMNSPLVKAYRVVRNLAAFPDVQVGWLPFVISRGLSLIRRERPAVIYSPGVPYSSAVAAHLLSRMTGVPYVIDFHDGWTDDMYQRYPTRLHHRAHRWLEGRVVKDAAGVIVYGDWLGNRLAERYPRVRDRIVEITHGYDPASRDAVVAAPRTPGKWRVVYMGSMFERCAPNLRTLLEALRGLPGEVRERFEVIFVGQAYDGVADEVESAGLAHLFRFLGYLPHQEALGWLDSADAAVMFLMPGDRASVSGKVFELMMMGKPILALVEPEGECARILRKAELGRWVTAPTDVETLRHNLSELDALGFPPPREAKIDAFSRVRQAETLAAVLRASARRGRRSVPGPREPAAA